MESENLKKKLRICFEEYHQNRIYFIKKFLEKNKHVPDPVSFLLRSLPERYKGNLEWAEIEAALDLMTDD